MIRLIAAFALLAMVFDASVARATDATLCGLHQEFGFWFKTDHSGPYAVDGNCSATLLSGTIGAAAGKITITSTSLTANTNTTVAAANANRIAMAIQCAGSGAVNVSETGATLASAAFGATGASLQIPSGTDPYFTPPIATLTAVTAYTATAQTCVVTEYNR